MDIRPNRLVSEASKSPAHLEGLGLISVHFALLELGLPSFVWALLDADERRGSIITAEMSFQRLCSAVSSLFRERYADTATVDELDALVKRAASAGETRNIAMHSIWAKGNRPDTLLREKVTAKIGRGYRYTAGDVSAAELRQQAADILQVASDLYAFKARFGLVRDQTI